MCVCPRSYYSTLLIYFMYLWFQSNLFCFLLFLFLFRFLLSLYLHFSYTLNMMITYKLIYKFPSFNLFPLLYFRSSYSFFRCISTLFLNFILLFSLQPNIILSNPIQCNPKLIESNLIQSNPIQYNPLFKSGQFSGEFCSGS